MPPALEVNLVLGEAYEEMGAAQFRDRVDCAHYFGRKTAIGLSGRLPTDGHLKRQEAVRKVAIEIFDVSETARRALGRHWQARTPAEREEFTRLFAELLESTYISKIDFYGGEQLKYVGESVDGDFAVVRATILRRQGADVPVEARMLRRSDRWYIYDIAVEGISLINNYRAQFDRIIQRSSYDELVRRLWRKRDEVPNVR